MKILKHLIGFVLFIVLLLGLLVGGVAWLTYNNEVPPTITTEEVNLDLEASDDLKASLNNISEKNYEENNITIDLTLNQLNNLLINYVRENYNPNYKTPNGDDFILKRGSLSLNDIYLVPASEGIILKLSINAFGFYKTTISLRCKLSYENENIILSFEEFTLGKYLGIKSGIAASILKKLNPNIGNANGFNLSTMSYKLSLRELLRSELEKNQLLEALFSCPMTAGFSSDGIYLSVNTTDLFNKGEELKKPSPINIDDKLKNGAVGPDYISFSITESELNKIILDNLNDKLYYEVVAIGKNTFNLRLEGLYYDIKTSTLATNLYIDSVKTSIKIEAETRILDLNGSKAISIKPLKTIIGSNVSIDIANLVPEITIDESLVGLNGKATIKDIIIDKENAKLDLKVKALV